MFVMAIYSVMHTTRSISMCPFVVQSCTVIVLATYEALMLFVFLYAKSISLVS